MMIVLAPAHKLAPRATTSRAWALPKGREAATDAPDDAFARLARLVASNDRELATLRTLDARMVEARAYLADPASPTALAQAYLGRVRDRREKVLAVLRANRLAAREFLAV